MRKILLYLFFILFSINSLNAQNITRTSEYSKDWVNRINRKTIDMQGA